MAGTPLFVTMSLGLLFAPGPTNTLQAVGGATNGLARSWQLVLAELSGYLIAIHLLAFVIGPLLQSSPVMQIALRVILSLYLLWLAFSLWRAKPLLTSAQTITPSKVFLVTLLNPKALVFAFVVLPPLSGQWISTLPQLAVLALMIIVASLCWISLGAAIASGKLWSIYTRYIPRAGGIVLGIFAVIIGSAAVH